MVMDQDTLVRALLRERAKLVSYIWSIVHEPNLADDVFQEVCLEAIHHIDQITDADHLLAWARRTARHRSLNALRQRDRQPQCLSQRTMDLLDRTWIDHDGVETDPTVAALHHCLDQLTPRSRRLVKLRYVDGLKGAAVASKLGQKLDAVYKALSRIHHQLIDCIGQHRRKLGEVDDA
ncbi:sigma-70 family RNA polymerase sigma factor [Planctomycetales bacterium ZRK34]|nr:sigma-70 family RNA polymerase sigma factor [Planctomycetales bacterium ZRK34]